MPVTNPPRRANGPLLLADIGGYTSFLHAVTEAHADDAFADGNVPVAYTMISSLLDGIVASLVPPYTLSKLEGDAVFAYATDDDVPPRGAAVIDALAACSDDFRRQVGGAEAHWTCRCDACARVDTLGLKFVLHAGSFVVHEVAGRDELVGTEVVMAHRLLKSSAAADARRGAYALVTEAAAAALDVPHGSATPLVETYEHYAPIQTYVFRLDH